MGLRANYAVSTSSNVDISARVRAYKLNVVANAEQGSVALSTLAVDDPDGGINIVGLHNIYLTETAEGSNQQRIYTGWTADRTITRGESFRTESSRLWNVSVADPNSIITRRIMRGSDANRPAETDVQRVAWLLTTNEFGNLVTTSRYYSTSYPVAMDAVDYRDQSNQQILDDCSQASGKNYFVFYDEPVSAYGLYYDFAGNSPYRSDLRISNVLGLIDNDIVYAASEDTKLNRDPSRVYSGVVLPYVGGEVYVNSAAISAAFFGRDTTAPSVNVKTAAKATARANRYIADASTEADVITTSVLLPLAKVNHIMEGMSLQCWFGHFTGYDTGWNWMRVLNRTVVAVSEEYYLVTLELAAAIGGLQAGVNAAGAPITLEGVVVPAPPIVAPTPPQTCVAVNGLTYSYTAAGTRGPLGLAKDPISGNYKSGPSTTFLQYVRTGAEPGSRYPLAGLIGDWGNGGGGGSPLDDCAGSGDGGDYNGGGVAPWVQITVVGPGQLAVVTLPGSGLSTCAGPYATTATATAHPNSDVAVTATDTQAVGATLNITIPSDGFCTHYVVIQGFGGCWGFGGATWTPA